MTENEELFYDRTTNTYFKSSTITIVYFHKKVLDEGYFNNPSSKYVDLVRDLQRRLGIPEISDDSPSYGIYEARDGQMLEVLFEEPRTLPDGTEVIDIIFEVDYDDECV